jgi:ribokinase
MIVVFGSINADLTARVDRFPQPGETLAGLSFAAAPGGKGANQALAARRAGAVVSMVGAVGSDPLAAKALSGLASGGVDIDNVRRVDTPTGVAMIQVDAQGQNSIVVVRGANDEVVATAVPDSALGPTTTLVLQLEVPLAAVYDIAARAHARGAHVVLNAAPAAAMPDALLSLLDVLIVNEHEAEALAATRNVPLLPEPFAVAMHQRFRCATIVTLGPRGVVAAKTGAILRAAAPPVDVVDTTGAGDAFVGAFAAALDRGALWRRALAEGVAAGSLACARAGAQAALPMAKAISQLADKVEPTIVVREPGSVRL